MQNRPLRLVMAAAFPFPSPQGSQVYVRGMARALARRGHDVTVACYGHGQGPIDAGYRVVRVPRMPGYRNLRAGPDLVKPWLDLGLAVRLFGQPADLVHAHNYEAPIAALPTRLLRGVPLVYSAHNTMGEELHTYFEGRLARGIARAAGAVLDRTVPRLADHAIAIDESAVGLLRGLGCQRVSWVPPGVDPEDLMRVAPASLPDGRWVVYAGNTDAYQDLDDLVAAMALVPEARLLLVSAGSLARWRHCGLPGLHCVRTSDWAEVASLLAAASVAALPRAVCSGYPIKLLNYLGMGLPTVAARGSARPLPGVVTVPDHDPAAMARALVDLLAHEDRRVDLGQKARQHVLSTCTWDARALDLERVYAEVLERKRRP